MEAKNLKKMDVGGLSGIISNKTGIYVCIMLHLGKKVCLHVTRHQAGGCQYGGPSCQGPVQRGGTVQRNPLYAILYGGGGYKITKCYRFLVLFINQRPNLKNLSRGLNLRLISNIVGSA